MARNTYFIGTEWEDGTFDLGTHPMRSMKVAESAAKGLAKSPTAAECGIVRYTIERAVDDGMTRGDTATVRSFPVQ